MCSTVCCFSLRDFRQPLSNFYFILLPSPVILLFVCIVALPKPQLLHKLHSFWVELAQKTHTSSTHNAPQLQMGVWHMQGSLN